jgi:hypothetical protein
MERTDRLVQPGPRVAAPRPLQSQALSCVTLIRLLRINYVRNMPACGGHLDRRPGAGNRQNPPTWSGPEGKRSHHMYFSGRTAKPVRVSSLS